ncbi:prolipoprotein diacylglyceryl transferase [Clostridium chromiireducens]|uniref:Phosphatidylglycerol--prolipoprotein diacylglyceryl transferase n=1 Tax=Clostridium chromiireducens TaxID=225345 RepID=A0A1V4IEH4_9CLOT|nr:prolipoprotein diacylglyceryl transferase [Clostridium chromiireducens]OPJ58336.1 prolipoprotein diacylglyceryl transferase [Clostridium chromiireducens]RII33514.1 prolipoprotein diacylglyceryl transferase [Clostridium chromiireducens]
MNPVAFSIGSFDIRWYGILIATGIVLGIVISQYNCKWRDADFDNLLNIVLLSLPFGIVGARLYYVIFEFDHYRNNIIEAINIRNGGLAIHGGLIFALGTALIYTKVKKLSFIKFADVAAPSIILAQALGRWGNFFNQEAHGDAVSYEFIKHFPMFIQNGMNINGTYYNPTFLYESTWNLLVFVILMVILRKSKVNGAAFFTYIGLYSIGRFIIEGMRTDSLMLGSIRMAQLVSLSGVVLWIVFIGLSYYKRVIKRKVCKE